MNHTVISAFCVVVAFGASTGCVEIQNFGAPSSSHADSGVSDGGAGTPSAEAGIRLSADGAAPAAWEWQNPKPAGNDLRGIWGTGPSDVWLVGAAGAVLHWDGAKMTAPYSGATDQTYYAVWSSAPNDVWIAGDGVGGTSNVLHFDGTTWSSDYTLNAGLVHSIWGTKATDVWALTGGTNGVIQHWDGTSWKISPIVNASGQNIVNTPLVRDVWGASSSDVWAVGDSGTLLHWTGAQQWDGGTDGTLPGPNWTQSTSSDGNPSYDPFSASNHYVGVWGSAANDVWAMFVGGQLATPAGGAFGFSHWDGTKWTIQWLTDYSSWCATLPQGPLETGHLLWGQDANTVVAAQRIVPHGQACTGGDPGDVYTWNPGTQGWTTAPANNAWSPSPLGLWGDSAGLYAVGASGGFEQWKSAQASWGSVLPGATYIELDAIAPVSQDEAWAVSWPAGLLHWEGATWSVVPFDATLGLGFVDVGASGPDDVWAVGQAQNPALGGTSGALVHWNGTAWSKPTFLSDTDFGELTGVWVNSPTDAWAVGYVVGGAAVTPGALVVFHWDGTTWSTVAVPPQINAKPRNSLYAWAQVSGLSANEMWITGNIDDGADDAYVLRWDGTSLTQIMDRPRAWSTPTKAWAPSSDDVWLAAAPAEVFDGKQWTNKEGSDYLNNAVFGSGPADVWLVGQGAQGGAIRHWDGKGITTYLDVTPILLAVGVTPKRDFLWAVGEGGATLRLPITTPGALR